MPGQTCPLHVALREMNAKADGKKGETVECEPLHHMLAGRKVNARLDIPGHLYQSPNGEPMILCQSKTRSLVYSVRTN